MSIQSTGSGSGLSPAQIEELRTTRADGRLLARAVEPGSRYSGSDASGTVSVVVDGRGVVQDVNIDPGWVRKVGPSALGDALMRAYQAAGSAALGASLQRYNEAVDAGGIDVAADEIRSQDASTAARVESTIDELMDAADRAQRELVEVKRRAAAAESRDEVFSRGGLMRFGLDHGVVTAITVVDRRRATQLRPDRLAAEALSLFRAAFPAVS